MQAVATAAQLLLVFFFFGQPLAADGAAVVPPPSSVGLVARRAMPVRLRGCFQRGGTNRAGLVRHPQQVVRNARNSNTASNKENGGDDWCSRFRGRRRRRNPSNENSKSSSSSSSSSRSRNEHDDLTRILHHVGSETDQALERLQQRSDHEAHLLLRPKHCSGSSNSRNRENSLERTDPYAPKRRRRRVPTANAPAANKNKGGRPFFDGRSLSSSLAGLRVHIPEWWL
jgi:hypothetical protein